MEIIPRQDDEPEKVGPYSVSGGKHAQAPSPPHLEQVSELRDFEEDSLFQEWKHAQGGFDEPMGALNLLIVVGLFGFSFVLCGLALWKIVELGAWLF